MGLYSGPGETSMPSVSIGRLMLSFSQLEPRSFKAEVSNTQETIPG